MKKCSKCNITKKDNEFYITKSRLTGSSMCKKCFNNYCIQRWIQRKIDAINYKGAKCQDCSIEFPKEPYVIFDFHHNDPSEKDTDWVKLRLKSWKSITKELDKCSLLCSNCHRKRHHTEM